MTDRRCRRPLRAVSGRWVGAIAGLCLLVAAAQAADFLPGDVNDDGFFDVLDSTVLRRDLAELGPGISQECVSELPATGQVTCWAQGGNVVPCLGTGQDGDVQAGATLSYLDNGDGTITDLTTGLTWEKLSYDGSIHDWNGAYRWETAFVSKIATLNSTVFAGHTDWRVPNHKELVSILDLEMYSPSVSPAFHSGCTPGCTVTSCSCTSSTWYWSSTSLTINGSYAFYVLFSDGLVNLEPKTLFLRVRAVRGP